MRLPRAASLVLSAICLGSSLHAATLASASPNPAYTQVDPDYLGQSFTVGGAGLFNGISFDFLNAGSTPYATGTAYLLTQAYAGAPSGLSTSTAGYVGSAAAAAGFYNFGNSVQLAGGTTYYLYENLLAPPGSVVGNSSSTLAQEFYYALNGGNFTPNQGITLAFNVTGNAVSTSPVSATPEPSGFALLGTGVLGMAGVLRRRFEHDGHDVRKGSGDPGLFYSGVMPPCGLRSASGFESCVYAKRARRCTCSMAMRRLGWLRVTRGVEDVCGL